MNVPDGFSVQGGDRIGFTYTGNMGLISFSYVEGERTYFRKLDSGTAPNVGANYIFDNIHLPSKFSVAVEIEAGENLFSFLYLTNLYIIQYHS